MEPFTQVFVNRSCPNCHLFSEKLPETSSYPCAENLNFEEVTQYWSGFFKEKIFFSYHRCTCGLLFCPNFFNEDQLSSLYKNMSDNTAGVSLNPLIKTQNGYFKLLKKYSDLKGNYLEFGPDIGLFTNNCLQKKTFSSYTMLEPNKAVWPTLKNKLQTVPHFLLSQLNELDAVANQSISTCIMIHVLDHLLEPGKVLHKIKEKLQPGGILLLVTHNEKSFLTKMIRKKWPPYCLQHPQLFNPLSLEALLKKTGFNKLVCEKTYNYFPFTYLLQHTLYALGIRKISIPQIKNLHLGLKLGNIATIAIA